MLTWLETVDESTFEQLPLLSVSGSGMVETSSSWFYGMRNAETYEEWVSLMFYIVCVTFGNISKEKLPNATGTSYGRSLLSGRCILAAKMMRVGDVKLSEIYLDVFLKRSSSILAMFWGTCFFWKAFDGSQKGETPETGQIQVLTLIQDFLEKQAQKLKDHPAKTKMRLSVVPLILKSPNYVPKPPPRNSFKLKQPVDDDLGFISDTEE